MESMNEEVKEPMNESGRYRAARAAKNARKQTCLRMIKYRKKVYKNM